MRDPDIDDLLVVTKALIQDFLGKNEMHEFDIVEIEFAISRNWKREREREVRIGSGLARLVGSQT